jgi:hypothetical protein
MADNFAQLVKSQTDIVRIVGESLIVVGAGGFAGGHLAGAQTWAVRACWSAMRLSAAFGLAELALWLWFSCHKRSHTQLQHHEPQHHDLQRLPG